MEIITSFSVQYRGKLKSFDSLPDLIFETADICRSQGWEYQIWDEDWSKAADLTLQLDESDIRFEGHAPLKGITFNLQATESVWLTFQSDGILHSLFTLPRNSSSETGWVQLPGADQSPNSSLPWHRVKTGCVGYHTHITLCKLFRYLSGKYFEEFEVRDETGYWHHGDDEKVFEWYAEYDRACLQLKEELNALDAFESIEPGEKQKIYYNLIKAFGEKFKAE